MNFDIIRITERPELKTAAAEWFHEKWGIPYEAYLESMEEAMSGKGAVPQWYLALYGDRIAAVSQTISTTAPTSRRTCAQYSQSLISAVRVWRGGCSGSLPTI